MKFLIALVVCVASFGMSHSQQMLGGGIARIQNTACQSSTCNNGGTCEPLPYACTCLCNGNECQESAADNTNTCMQTCNTVSCRPQPAGLYRCECTGGFTGKNCEDDIDECETDEACPAGHRCINTVGSFTCEDINECAANPCKNGECQQNEPGKGYKCTCKAGWTGTNCDLGRPVGISTFSKFKITGAAGTRYDIRILRGIGTRAGCVKKCFTTNDCLSVDYWSSSKRCDLSRENKFTILKKDKKAWQSSGGEHGDLVFFKPTDLPGYSKSYGNCKWPKESEKQQNAAILAHLWGVSLKQCQAVCINTQHFRCKGVNYNESERSCTLHNSVTYEKKKNPKYVFYKARCTKTCKDLGLPDNRECDKTKCSKDWWYCQKTCGLEHCYVQ